MPGLIWQPYFAPASIGIGALAVAALVVWSAWRSFAIRPVVSLVTAAVRLAVVVVLAILLMGPSYLPEADLRTESTQLLVMIDTSSSMRTADMPGGSRFEFAREHWLNADQLAALRRRHRIELIGFDRQPRRLGEPDLQGPVEQWAAGAQTNLPDSLRQVISEADAQTTAGVLLISDGRDSEDRPLGSVAALARSRSLPVHVVPIGGPNLRPDLMVSARPAEDYLLAGETGRIIIRAMQFGAPAARSVVHLKGPDRAEQQQVVFDGRRTERIEIPIKQEQPGVYQYSVSIDPLADELEQRNNEVAVFVEVTAGRFKVLLLEGQPFWDTKFIAQSLRKDERIELTQITQVTPSRIQTVVTRSDDHQVRVPRSAEELAQYDVVILGSGLEFILTEADAHRLTEYVADHGGQLIFARGRAYDPGSPTGRAIGRALAVIEPVVWGRGSVYKQALDLEPLGRSHPSFSIYQADHSWDQIVRLLPALDTAPVVHRTKAAARVLARLRQRGIAGDDQGQPAILNMPYGRGMVVAIVGEGLWKWNLSARRDERLVGVYDRFWSNMVRWLALGSGFQPDQDLALRLSSRVIKVGDALNIDLVHRFGYDATRAYQLKITDPQGQARVVLPTVTGNSAVRASAEFTPDQAGVHQVQVVGPDGPVGNLEARFQAFDMDLERIRCAADPQSLRQLARLSGGQRLDPHRPEAVLDVLDRQQAAAEAPPQPKYIWDRGMVLIALLSVLGLEWIGRKRGGLL